MRNCITSLKRKRQERTKVNQRKTRRVVGEMEEEEEEDVGEKAERASRKVD